MTIIQHLLSTEVIEALGWTLLHSLWQGAVLAIILAVLLVLMHRFSSTTRYVVSVFMLFLFFACSVSSFFALYQPAITTTSTTINIPNTIEKSTQTAPIFDKLKTKSTVLNQSESTALLTKTTTYFSKHIPLLVTLWLLGVLVLILRFLGSLGYIQRLKHYKAKPFSPFWQARVTDLENQLQLRQKVTYVRSLIAPTPMAVGCFRPFVLIPAKLMTGLTEEQIEAILIHELAHIKRNDYAVNVLQSLVEILFFYHPAVWWMSSAVRHERENCCDDMAIALTGETINYAKTLILLKEQHMKTSIPAVAFSGLKNSFSHRVKRLFETPIKFADFREGFATALILVMGIGLLSFSSPHWVNTTITHTLSTPKSLGKLAASTPLETLESENNPTDILKKKSVIESNPPKLESQQNISSNDDLELLIEAIDDGNYKMVKYLIEKGANVNGRTRDGWTPLMEAVDEDNLKIVTLLIEHKADVNAKDTDGHTVLMEAINDASLPVVQYLLDNGADVNARTREGWTPLMEAADEGHLKVVQLLVQYKADINAVDRDGNSVLMEAINDSPNSVVEYLIENGADINAKNRDGDSVLMEAINEGRKEVVQLLMSKGVKVNNTQQDNSAMMEAIEEDQEEILEMLLEKGGDVNQSNREGETPLMEAIDEGNIRLVKLLLSKGANINHTTKHGNTPLLEAVEEGYTDIVIFLLEKGADVNENRGHGTPLMEALDEGNSRMCQLLIEKGADVNLADKHNSTPLMECADEGLYDTAKMLIAKGAKVDAATTRGKTALFEAVDEGHLDLVRLFVQEGANVNQVATNTNQNIRMDDGIITMTHEWTPLFEAVDEEHQEIAAFLLQNGAKIETRIKKSIRHLNTDEVTLYEGWTVLMEAAQAGDLDMLQFLVKQGAEVHAKTGNGKTALDIAKAFGHRDVVRYLGAQ